MLAKFRKIEKWQKKRRDFFSVIFFPSIGIIILLFVVWLIVGNLRVNRERAGIDSRINSLKEEIQKLQERKEFLQSQISRTKEEEEEYLEEKARDLYDLQKEGEKAVIIKEKEE